MPARLSRHLVAPGDRGRAIRGLGGEQRRDLLYVEDAAEAFLLAAVTEEVVGLALNVGGDEPCSLMDLAETIVEANGGGTYEIRAFPPERKRIDIGDFQLTTAASECSAGWHPRISLAEGLRRSLDYYRRHLTNYL